MKHLLFPLLLVSLLAGGGPAEAEYLTTRLSAPQPDFDQPRRIMLQLSSDDEKAMNNILFNAVNLQKFYGMDNVEIAIVVFGPGMKALYRETSPVRERIESLLKYDVSFVGCGNTMEATDRKAEDLIEGVDFVQAGIAEIVERQLDGWLYVRP